MKEMKDKDKLIFYKSKQKMLFGNYAPLIIENTQSQGYVVKANDTIVKNTFICEYSGEIEYRDKIYHESNSIMELVKSDKDSTTLDINPDENTNIARFISGINNKTMKNEQNVKSFNCLIDGFPHVILYTIKNIKKGDILYYDYNEGDSQKH
jgi:hypothetical protein